MVTRTWLPVYSETTPEDHLFDQDLYVTDLQTYSMCCSALYKDRLSFWLVTTLFEQVFVGPHVSPFSSLPLNEMQCRTTKLSRGQEGARGGETTTKLWISSLASPFTALLHPLTECSTWEQGATYWRREERQLPSFKSICFLLPSSGTSPDWMQCRGAMRHLLKDGSKRREASKLWEQ